VAEVWHLQKTNIPMFSVLCTRWIVQVSTR